MHDYVIDYNREDVETGMFLENFALVTKIRCVKCGCVAKFSKLGVCQMILVSLLIQKEYQQLKKDRTI